MKNEEPNQTMKRTTGAVVAYLGRWASMKTSCYSIAVCLLGVGCASIASIGVPTKPFAFTELVMEPGMTIAAMTSSGTIQIYADDELKRTYTWEGASRSVRLWPRPKRWYGSLGAYYPGPGSHWFPHNGISRGVLNEGQMHFDSEQEALAWLNTPWHKKAGSVYRDDGLFVLFSKTPAREQLNVDVFQIYIHGKKPQILQDSKDCAITVDNQNEAQRLKASCCAKPQQKPGLN